jgi:hypothetical protein
MFWRYILPPSSGLKLAKWVSFCVYVDLCFKRMIGEKSRGWGPVWVNRNSGLEKF